MNLWQQMLCALAQEGNVEVRFPQLNKIEKLLELRCYQALLEIKNIIEDDTLDDPTCFWKIEKIVRVFENIGSDGGSRHDF